MVIKLPRFQAVVVLLVLLSVRGVRCESGLLSKLQGVAPCAELLAVARANQIPLEQIDPLSDAGTLKAGDSITALVVLDDKGKRRLQWLLYLKVSGERVPGTNKHSRMVMHSSTGSKLEFVSTPADVTLRTLGPFDASPRKRALKHHDKTAQFTLDEGFLALGLDRSAVALMRLRKTKVKGSFAFSGQPFSEATIAKTRKMTDPVRLTLEEERALAGAAPALMSYFNVVQRTEGLSEILFELIDLPSMWSLLRRGGVNTNFRFANENLGPADDSAWNLGFPIYNLPLVLELNKHPALNITFVATAPRPPLLPCAGVVALLAEKPGHKETYLALRILSARRGAH
jgi:hypothetical protein